MTPYIGLAAFSLLVPITLAILGVLFFVTLSYLDVIQYYTKAGGAYVVARDNFGPRVAQVAAVALLIDYTVTVAVQTAAGTANLTSAIPSLANTTDTVAITVGVVLLLLYGNLRGIREAGRVFAIPTYFYVVSLATVIIVGYVKKAAGRPAPHPRPAQQRALRGAPRGTERLGLADGAGLHLPPALVRQRRLVADRPGGHLQRGGQLPSSGLAARPPDPGRHELGAGLPRAGHHAAGQVDPCAALRQRLADRGLPRGRGHLRAGHRLLHRGDRHHPHPLHRGQHQLQRLPLPGQLRGRRPLPAPSADPAGPPPGLLQRDPRAGRGLHRPGPGVQGPGRRAGGALRHRRVHRLHHGGRGHGQAPPHPQGGALAPERAGQRVLGLPGRHRWC